MMRIAITLHRMLQRTFGAGVESQRADHLSRLAFMALSDDHVNGLDPMEPRRVDRQDRHTDPGQFRDQARHFNDETDNRDVQTDLVWPDREEIDEDVEQITFGDDAGEPVVLDHRQPADLATPPEGGRLFDRHLGTNDHRGGSHQMLHFDAGRQIRYGPSAADDRGANADQVGPGDDAD